MSHAEPSIDVWSALLTRTQGNAQIARVLLERLLIDLPQQHANLTAALDSGALEEAQRQAHGLRSAAAVCGLDQVREAAKVLEISLIARNSGVNANWQIFCADLDDALRAVLQQSQAQLAQLQQSA